MKIEDAVQAFLADRKVNGCSKDTVRFYEYTVGSFYAFISNTDNSAVSIDEIAQYINLYFLSLQEKKLSYSTHHAHVRGIRAFTKFLHTNGQLDPPRHQRTHRNLCSNPPSSPNP